MLIPIAHLLIILGLAGLSTFCVARAYRSPSAARWFVALTLGTAITLAIGLSSLTTTDRGQPIQQWVLPGICLVMVLAMAREGRFRNLSILILLLGMLGLSHHYRTVVQGEQFLGTERAVEGQRLMEAHPAWHTTLTGLYEVETNTGAQKPDKTQH